MTAAAIELAFIREFSVGGNQIARAPTREARRERVRSAIYTSGRLGHPFYDTQMNYAEAFRACFGERLDRRAAIRELPPEDVEEQSGEEEFKD
jgi:hypothetical protein